MPLPKADAHNTREGKKNTKRNAQAPDSFGLIASSLACAGPDPVVDFAHVLADGVDEGNGIAVVVGQGSAVEVGKGLADCDGHDDDGDEEETVHAGVDEEWELRVVVEDVSYGAVENSDACLEGG